MLAAHCKENPWNWEEQIRKVCFAYNSSVHCSTGFTPFYLMYGRQAILPIDLQYSTVEVNQHQSTNEYATKLHQRLTAAFELARTTAGISHERQKLYYDQKTHGDLYRPGDLVWLLSPKVPKNSSKKLFHPWTGPFKVLKKLSDSTYRVQRTEGRRQRQVVHFNRLKPCPKDIRIAISDQPTITDGSRAQPTSETRKNTNDSPKQPPMQPVGTHLEIVDDDDEPQTGNQSSTNQADNQLPTVIRRYPAGQHRPPVRLQDYVRS